MTLNICYARNGNLKSTICLAISAFLTACGGGSGSTSDTEAILGEWSFLYEAVQCRETYAFNADGSWNVRSLDERVSGTYTYSPQLDVGQLALTANEDNLQADCLGSNFDSRGITTSISVQFSSSTQMIWSFLSNGQVVATLTLDRD